jgi:anti-sigma-K factor RskA
MNEHVDELLALYALGGLEADEVGRVETHLPRCAACRAEAQTQQRLVAALATTAPPLEPDPRLRARILARAERAQAAASRAAPPRLWTLPRWVPVTLSLALAVLAGWNVYLTQEVGSLRRQVRGSIGAVALISAPDTRAISLVAREAMPLAGGQAYLDGEAHDLVLVVHQLTPPKPDQAYQTWLITDDGPVSTGALEVSTSGWGMAWLSRPYIPGSAICVSLEPASGSAAPTEVVLWGRFRSSD